MKDSVKLQRTIYDLLESKLKLSMNDDLQLRWLREALSYLRMFPPSDYAMIQPEEQSLLFSKYKREKHVTTTN